MRGAAVAEPRRDVGVAALLAAGACAFLAAATVAQPALGIPLVAGAGVLLLAAVAVRRPVLPWQYLLVAVLVVILFVPMRRYQLPGGVGFGLEPYRLLVAFMLAGWAAALLVDPRVTLRRSGFELPLGLIAAAVGISLLVNPARVAELQGTALKAVTFLFSFVLVFYLVVSVVRSRRMADVLVRTLVLGGATLGLLAVVEARTGFTPFTQLDSFIPVLTLDPEFDGSLERGVTRAFGPAEHPIALGAALAMLVPLAIYLARTRSTAWYVALGALMMGAIATVSRTAILMLAVVVLVFLWLRPRDTRRLWPVLVPLLAFTHFAAPGAMGSLHDAFFPEGGLVADQERMAGSCDSAGRVADLGPTLAEVAKQPLAGYGYGTRITTFGPDRNACILDNQWLGTLLDVGIMGAFAWLLLYLRVLRRLGRRAKIDDSPTGWLLVAVTAAVISYAVGNLTFDALGFSQVTFLLFVILALGAAVTASDRKGPDDGEVLVPAPASRPPSPTPAAA